MQSMNPNEARCVNYGLDQGTLRRLEDVSVNGEPVAVFVCQKHEGPLAMKLPQIGKSLPAVVVQDQGTPELLRAFVELWTMAPNPSIPELAQALSNVILKYAPRDELGVCWCEPVQVGDWTVKLTAAPLDGWEATHKDGGTWRVLTPDEHLDPSHANSYQGVPGVGGVLPPLEHLVAQLRADLGADFCSAWQEQ